MSISDTNFMGIMPYEEVKNGLEEIIRGCMNNRALITDEKTISKIKKIEDAVKKILDGMDSCDLAQDYNVICAQLEELLSLFDDQDKDLDQLKALIESHYNHIIEMEIMFATTDLENKNRFHIKPLAISEYQQELQQELEDCKKQPSNCKDHQLHKQHYIEIFNCEVLIAGSNRILDYRNYLEYQINMLTNMVLEAVYKYSEKPSLTSDQTINMLDDISFELQALLKYANEKGVYQSGIVKRIEEIRQKMHQDYPMQTLTFPEYQQVYTKLWTIAKQISCEYYLTIEEMNARPTGKEINMNRYPLVWQVQSNLQPSEIYPYILRELDLLIGAFNFEYHNIDSEDCKEVIWELYRKLIALKPYANSYPDFKIRLNKIHAYDHYTDSASELLKGLIDCINELEERTQMLEIEVANNYLSEYYPYKDLIRDAYFDVNEKMNKKETEASTLSKQLSDNTIILSENERSSRADEVKNAWSNTVYYQMLLEGITKKAEICNIELLPGQSKQQKPPVEGK